jgi:hypothetical protein
VKQDFIQGIAAALAEIHRLHGCEVEVSDVLSGMGLDIADLQKAKVERYDIDILKKIVRA